MREDWAPATGPEYADYLRRLRAERKSLKANTSTARPRRIALTPDEREIVLAKTAGRCHVCGGQIVDSKWHADHVLAHSGGGVHSVDNYLPAHPTCNNYRWDYLADEFQEILRMGVWLRTQVERQTAVGRQAGEAFVQHERKRIERRKPQA